ncbi:MAG: alpha-amylase family glycosyl hydrolase [Muribaculaceae bacterium]
MRNFTKILIGGLMAITSLSASAGTFVGDRTDFRDETIYFAMTTRFYDGDPKNNVLCWDNQSAQIETKDPCWRGDFKGLIEKLDYIKALGFTAIWITPIVQNASGYDYHGYHAMDFSRVDLRYESHIDQGSDEDVTFQSLIDAAHSRGMKIILDVVFNHTGNFGESHFCSLFERDQRIRNQANINTAIIPDYSKLGADYDDVAGGTQHSRRLQWMKNVGGVNYDNHNFWHHIGTSWNWDEPSRWWGQIAGDCVDLNTENQAVSDYLVECYGKFIEMGVDGFRIDTSGHIARLTFNTSFIPQLIELGEKYKAKRLNGCPFYMFGEVCARFSEVTYRNHPNLSPYYYTWKSPESLVSQWNHDAAWWDSQVLPEGCSPVGNMTLCLEEPDESQNSDNVFLKNGEWHEPDYSQASGFNVIDFPMHYNFSNAGSAVNIAKSGDKYYNDASFNVVYVDSHDYGPQPSDGVRFAGGTSQWAENLSLMFTFRGIPCIYYGSEVEFQKGKVIDNGPNGPLSNTGRAYFGAYLEGDVTASDFGVFSASGNVAQTLDGDLAQHIRRLNLIRAAVPALRKGQYTFDGCSASGGWAFKRAYKDSYALVAVNGGATFSSVPNGTYVDIVTGQSYNVTSGSVTVTAPTNQGQLRVLVKDWAGGKVGEDGQFIYTTSAVAHGGNPSFSDSGATFWYGPDDAIGRPAVSLSPAGGSFKTETLTITATLNEAATTGWIQVGSGARQTLTAGSSLQFTIGADMDFGDKVTVSWGASDSADEYTGEATYKKVDPNATITIYVTGPKAPHFYGWYKDDNGNTVQANGAWPGKQLSDTKTIDGRDFYYFTFEQGESVNFILSSNGSNQTSDITGITENSYYEWDGGSGCELLTDINPEPEPAVKVSPAGGKFVGTVTVTLTANQYTTSATYTVGNGSPVNFTGTTTVTLGEDMNDGESVTLAWSAIGEGVTRQGSYTFTKVAQSSQDDVTIYFDNSLSNWSNVNLYVYGSSSSEQIMGNWPGKAMSLDASTGYYKYTFSTDLDYTVLNVIFNNGSGSQTGDNVKIVNNGIYNVNGYSGTMSNIEIIDQPTEEPVIFYDLQGRMVENPQSGMYIRRQGNRVTKVYIH